MDKKTSQHRKIEQAREICDLYDLSNIEIACMKLIIDTITLLQLPLTIRRLKVVINATAAFTDLWEPDA